MASARMINGAQIAGKRLNPNQKWRGTGEEGGRSGEEAEGGFPSPGRQRAADVAPWADRDVAMWLISPPKL